MAKQYLRPVFDLDALSPEVAQGWQQAKLFCKDEVIQLHNKGDLDALGEMTVIPSGPNGPAVQFKEDAWHNRHLVRTAGERRVSINFKKIPEPLKTQLKLVAWASLYIQVNQQVSKLSTELDGQRHLALLFARAGVSSLSELSNKATWKRLVDLACTGAKGSIQLRLGMLNSLNALSGSFLAALGLAVPFSVKNPKRLAQKTTSEESNQHFAMPQRIMQGLYGYADKKIEEMEPLVPIAAQLWSNVFRLTLDARDKVDLTIAENGTSYGADRSDKLAQTHAYTSAIENTRGFLLARHCYENMEFYKPLFEAVPELLGSKDHRKCNTAVPSNLRIRISVLIQLHKRCLGYTLLLCMGFSGMRISEAKNLHARSYTITRDFIDGRGLETAALTTIYHKFSEGEHGKEDRWVCAQVCGKAIDFLVALNQPFYDYYAFDTPYLFLSPREIGSVRAVINPSALIDLKAVFVSWPLSKILSNLVLESAVVVTPQDREEAFALNPHVSKSQFDKKVRIGEPWPLTSHQFRRSLAVFLARHHLVCEGSLMKQFKHVRLTMTRWYMSGFTEIAKQRYKLDEGTLRDIQFFQEQCKDIRLKRAFTSDEPLVGGRGKQIMKERQQNKLYTDRAEADVDVAMGSVALTPMGNGLYCSNPDCTTTAIVRADSCVTCPNSYGDRDSVEFWKRMLTVSFDELEKAKRLDLSDSSIVHSREQIRLFHTLLTEVGETIEPLPF